MCYISRNTELQGLVGSMHYLSDYRNCAARPVNPQQNEEKLNRLFDLLYQTGEMSRTDLARVMGLSLTTVSALVEELMQRGLVVENGYAPAAQGGRRAINLCVNAQGRQIPTFTIGREGVRYQLYNLGIELLESIDLPFDGEDFVELVKDTLFSRSNCFSKQLALGVCICIPGIYRPERRAFVQWNGASLRVDALERLEAELGVPLFLGNEMQCITYAEAMHRPESEVDGLIYVRVTQQVQACIYVNGAIYTGKDNYAGQLGHISINYRGRPCSCGRRGCLERYVNTDAVQMRIQEVVALKRSAMLNQMTGGDVNGLKEGMAAKAYEAGDPVVVEMLDEIAEQLFVGIYNMVNICGVGHVVLGGNVARLSGRFLERMQALARQATGSHLLRGITIDSSLQEENAVSRGLAGYFVRKRFEIR